MNLSLGDLSGHLGVVKKHHFWLLMGGALVAGLIGWSFSTSALSKDYEANHQKVVQEFQELAQITSVPEPANATAQEGVAKLTEELKANVEQAWGGLYDEQSQSVLQWPKELGDDFKEWNENATQDMGVDSHFRDRYNTFRENEFNRLLKLIDAKGFFEEASSTPTAEEEVESTPEEALPEHDYKVIWNEDNQEAIDQSLSIPNDACAFDFRCALENLWVCRALLGVISNVNQGATGNYNAKVRIIDRLEIGINASKQLAQAANGGQVMRLAASSVSTEAPVDDSGSAGPPVRSVELHPVYLALAERQVPKPVDARRANLEFERYVDETGTPAISPDNLPAEFKRIPIFMQLRMDQRAIADLLVECANSSLPIEVSQVRINPKSRGEMGGAMSVPRMGPGFYGFLPGPGIGRERPLHELKTEEVAAYQFPYDIPIEILGSIQIYSQVDPKRFEAEAADAGSIAGGP